MNLQIFPNWGKKVGVTMFIIGLLILSFLIINAIINSTKGTSPYETGYLFGKQLYNVLHTETFLGIVTGRITTLLTIMGMIIFLLSKEKVEDEYINKLRLEAYQLTSFLVACLLFLVFILGGNISALFLLYIFFASYLVIFTIKKASV